MICLSMRRGETCFIAGFAEELFGVPAVFDGDLGKKEAGVSIHFGDESVSSDDDGGRSLVRRALEKYGHGENGDFDLDLSEFPFIDRVKSGVVNGGMLGGVFDRVAKRHDGEGEADASPEVAEFGERYKDSPLFGEDAGEFRFPCWWFSGYCGLSVESCSLQGKLSFGLTEEMHNHVGIRRKR